MSPTLDIRPLGGSFAAEVIGFDPAQAADRAMREAWHAALDEHQLLVFRDIDLDATAQLAMVGTLGVPLVENDSGRPYQHVSNVHEEGILGDEAFAFHVDHAFMPDPIEVISLYGLEIPTQGSQTRFVSGIAAAASLPAELRRRIGGRRARHVIDPAGDAATAAVRRRLVADDLPHAHHPMLLDDPRSGRPILFVSEQQTDLVEGLEEREGRQLIEALLEHLACRELAYEHEWREGDLVVWNNLALQHARSAIPRGARRTLRRISIGGTAVHEYFRRIERWERRV
jgi:taurine dioxygenase